MRAIAFGGLRQMKMLFFSNPPHTPHEECSLVFCYYSLSLYISLSISLFLVLPLIWTLTSKSAPRMSVTNCSPTLWQCFFSSRAVYDLLFFLFLFFFSVFFPFQGLAHLTLNDQGMGSFFFILVMIFFFFFRGGIDSTSASPAPQNYGFCYHCPPQLFTSPRCLIPPLLPEVFLVISSHAHSTSWSHQPSSAFIFSLFLLPSFLCRPPRPCAFLHRHTNLCPHPFCPCPMAHVLDLHLWPHLTPTTWPWGTKVTLFCYPFRFCLEGRRNKKCMKNVCLLVKLKMCPDFHSLTLQGESVAECAEFLVTTLLTFPLFGISKVFRDLRFMIWFYLEMCVIFIVVCLMFPMNTACCFYSLYFHCRFVVQQCRFCFEHSF